MCQSQAHVLLLGRVKSQMKVKGGIRLGKRRAGKEKQGPHMTYDALGWNGSLVRPAAMGWCRGSDVFAIVRCTVMGCCDVCSSSEAV